MYKAFHFVFLLFIADKGVAQGKPIGLKLTCAANDSIIYSADIKNCGELELTSNVSSTYKIKSFAVWLVHDGKLMHIPSGYERLSIQNYLQNIIPAKDAKPSKMIIDDLVIAPISGGPEIKFKKSFKFYVKR
jgi:hypothetical protein